MFNRKSSGIVKSLNSFDFFNMNLLYMGVTAGASYPLLVWLSMPSANAFLATLLGATFNIPLLVLYYLLTLKFPQNGGDYNYVYNAFGRKIAMFFGVMILLVYIMLMPVLANLEVILGLGLQNPNFFIIEIVTIVALLTVLWRKVFRFLLSSFAILQIIQAIIIIITLLFTHPDISILNFNFKDTITLALIYNLSTFLFLNSPSYLAGETKNAKKSFMWGYFGAYFTVMLLIALISLLSNSQIYFINEVNQILQHYTILFYFNLIISATWYFVYMMIDSIIEVKLAETIVIDHFDFKRPISLKEIIFIAIIPLTTFWNVIENYFGITINFATDGLIFMLLNFLFVAIASFKLGINKIVSILTIASIIFQAVWYEIFYSFSMQNIWLICIPILFALILTITKTERKL